MKHDNIFVIGFLYLAAISIEGNSAYRNVIGIDVVGALFIVDRLELEPTVIVWENIREAILRPVAGQVRRGAGLIPADVL